MVEKGGKCCEGMAMHKEDCHVWGYVFGGVVLAALAVVIILQSKILKSIHKSSKKK